MVKEKGIVVCSLFDGMSGTQMALKNLGIKVDTYYASEIDKPAIQITRKNFPDTIHLGDVRDVKGEDFIKDIDLVVAGSPCQGFSFAGKQLAFDDPRSALFFEFIRILREVKPKYFLLENVRMKKEFQDVISEQISSVYPEYTSGGLFSIEPILINSALVSAQNRNRLYWTNIPGIEQPEDLGIVLRDVLETCGSHGLDKMTTKDGKSYALTATYQGAVAWNSIERKQRTMIPTYDTPKKLYDIPREILKDNERQRRVYSKDGKSPTVLARSDSAKVETYNTPKQVGVAKEINGHDILKRVYSEDGKSPTLNSMGGGNREPKVAVKKKVNLKEYNDEIAINPRNFGGKGYVGTNKKSVALTQPSGNNATLVRVKGGAIRARSKDSKGKHVGWKETKPKQVLEIRKDDKSNSLTSATKDSVAVSKIRNKSKTVRSGGRLSYDRHEWDSVDELHWRKLTPLECERLQTFPDNYSEGVSNTQRYKMLGNGFTVRVIEHILKNMEI